MPGNYLRGQQQFSDRVSPPPRAPNGARSMRSTHSFVSPMISPMGPASSPPRRADLAAWRMGLIALDGRFTHPIHAALADTVHRYQIPLRDLLDVIDGVESDLEPTRFATFADLYPYCYRVASAVGLACVRVWGLRAGARFEEAGGPAEAAGIAFQLTNILRDLGEDFQRGRIYLPGDELELLGCPPETWFDPSCRAARPGTDPSSSRASAGILPSLGAARGVAHGRGARNIPGDEQDVSFSSGGSRERGERCVDSARARPAVAERTGLAQRLDGEVGLGVSWAGIRLPNSLSIPGSSGDGLVPCRNVGEFE